MKPRTYHELATEQRALINALFRLLADRESMIETLQRTITELERGKS